MLHWGAWIYQYVKKWRQWPQMVRYCPYQMYIGALNCWDEPGKWDWVYQRCSIVVSLHVAMEITRLGKSKIADFATIRFFSTMDSLMLGEGRSIGESFATVITPVWSLTRVGPQVGSHWGALREPLLANWATKWLLSTMGTQMGCQIGCLGEGLCTDFTAIGLLPTMCSHVGLESGGSSIAFATYLADIVSRFVCWLGSWFGAWWSFRHCIDLSGNGGRSVTIAVYQDRLHVCWILGVLHTRTRCSWAIKACAIDMLTWGICTTHAESRYQVWCAVVISITPNCWHASGRHGRWCRALRRCASWAWLVVEREKGSDSFPLFSNLVGYDGPVRGLSVIQLWIVIILDKKPDMGWIEHLADGLV